MELAVCSYPSDVFRLFEDAFVDSESAVALSRRFLQHLGCSVGEGGGGSLVLPTARTFFPHSLLFYTANGRRPSLQYKLKQVKFEREKTKTVCLSPQGVFPHRRAEELLL